MHVGVMVGTRISHWTGLHRLLDITTGMVAMQVSMKVSMVGTLWLGLGSGSASATGLRVGVRARVRVSLRPIETLR